MAYVPLVLRFVPIIRLDIFTVVNVPEIHVENKIGTAEIKTSVESDIQRVVIGFAHLIYPVPVKYALICRLGSLDIKWCVRRSAGKDPAHAVFPLIVGLVTSFHAEYISIVKPTVKE